METILEFQGEYRFLSNFFPCKVDYEGISYPSAEHAYQASKSQSQNERLIISRLRTPGIAKRVGQRINASNDFFRNREKIMEEIVRIKFQDPYLKEKLLSTGDKILVEGNSWHDHFWGVCQGKGLNKLGNILMKVRSELRKQFTPNQPSVTGSQNCANRPQ